MSSDSSLPVRDRLDYEGSGVDITKSPAQVASEIERHQQLNGLIGTSEALWGQVVVTALEQHHAEIKRVISTMDLGGNTVQVESMPKIPK